MIPLLQANVMSAGWSGKDLRAPYTSSMLPHIRHHAAMYTVASVLLLNACSLAHCCSCPAWSNGHKLHIIVRSSVNEATYIAMKECRASQCLRCACIPQLRSPHRTTRFSASGSNVGLVCACDICCRHEL